MPYLRIVPLLAALAFANPPSLAAERMPGEIAGPSAGSNWDHVKVLPFSSRLHVSTDHGGGSCRVFRVSDDALTCAGRGGVAGRVLPRTEIKQIKMAHPVRSALIGAGVVGGVGAIAGGIAGRKDQCPTLQGLCLTEIGISGGGVAAIFGVGGALVGGAVGGLTDVARGDSIYTRP